MASCWRALCWLLLAPALAIAQPQPQLTAEQQRWVADQVSVEIATVADWPPFEYLDEDGQLQGILPDLLTLMAERTGLPLTLRTDTWQNNLDNFARGKVDGISAITQNETRKGLGRFSNPHVELVDYFFAPRTLATRPFAELVNQRVAIPSGYAGIEFVRRHFPEMPIVEADNLQHAIDLVIEGKAELLFNSYIALAFLLQQEGVTDIVPIKSMRAMGKRPLRLVTSHDNPLLAAVINKGLASITAAEQDAIFRRHLGGGLNRPSSALALTTEERRYLSEHPRLSFTGDPSWLPYEALDARGNYIGIVADFLPILEQRLGISLDIKIEKTWLDSVAAFKAGKVDIISETARSGQRQALYTPAFLESPVVLVMRDDQSYVTGIDEVSHLNIAVLTDYGYLEQLHQTYPDLPFIQLPTLEDGLTAVAVGQADVLIATLAQASYQIARAGMNNLRIVGSTEFTTRLALGVQPDNPLLASILTKALASISPEEKQQVLRGWADEKFVERTNYGLIAQLVASFLVVIVTIVLWYQKLLSEIERRRVAEAQHQALIDLLPIEILVVSPSGKILSANPQVLADHQVGADTIVGSHLSELLAEDTDYAALGAALAEGTAIDQQIVEFSLSGKPNAMMVSLLPIIYQKRQARLLLAVNISSRLAMEQALEEAKNAAIGANRAKSTFLANMSHEIRTPMNAIIGFTELLHERLTDPKLASYVTTIRSAGNNLLLLINDILDLSKVEAGKLTLAPTPCDPHGLLNEAADVFALTIKQKGLDLLLDIDPSLPHGLLLDETRLRQILFNLLGNAVKFTDKGNVTLRVRVARLDNAQHRLALVIAVIDSGIGIEPSDIPHLFNSFEQARGQSQSTYGGSGLGLAISRRLAQLMGGTLKVKSTPGIGSSFSLEIPDIAIVDNDEMVNRHHGKENLTLHFDNARLLVVDDVDDNRALLQEALPSHGLDVDIACDGTEALAMVSQADYQLILLDIRMPGMDGYKVARVVKQQYPELPIIAVTASVMRDDYERIRRDDFDGYIRKPVMKQELLLELACHLPHRELPGVSSGPIDDHNSFHLDKPASLTALQQQFLSDCRVLNHSNNLDDSQALAARLLEFAERQQEPGLACFARRWLLALETLDVMDIRQCQQQLLQHIHSDAA